MSGTPLQAANTVVQAINGISNGGGLTPFANLFDSDGVTFAPYYHVIPSYLELTGSQFESDWLLQNPPTRLWGHSDGTGNPINLNIRDYFNSFVWNHPYHNNATVTLISSNTDFQSQGNTLNNMLTTFPIPQYRIVEYHQSGVNPTYGGMDWSSLMVVLKNVGTNQWTLVGLVHGSWTI